MRQAAVEGLPGPRPLEVSPIPNRPYFLKEPRAMVRNSPVRSSPADSPAPKPTPFPARGSDGSHGLGSGPISTNPRPGQIVIDGSHSENQSPGPKLGRLPRISDTRALLYHRFASPRKALPEVYDFWAKRAPFPLVSFGNMSYGDCTRAKQAVAMLRMERIETRRTPTIDPAEVVRAYFEMTYRRYGVGIPGGQPSYEGDVGAYETDALSDWRNPDTAFPDTHGRKLVIDAYLRVNSADHLEMRNAVYTAGSHGIAICINLPAAFESLDPPAMWDIPDGQALTGPWVPGSWGGHSMWATGYNRDGFIIQHTWERPAQVLTYRAAAKYLDEAHLVIDKADYWRQHMPEAKRLLDWAGIKKAVNAVSATKLQ